MGFEPMVPLRHNCLAGSPIQPLSHLSTRDSNNGGGSRIRTHGTLRYNGFQDRRFRPLSHPTKIASLFYQRSSVFVKKIPAPNRAIPPGSSESSIIKSIGDCQSSNHRFPFFVLKLSFFLKKGPLV